MESSKGVRDVTGRLGWKVALLAIAMAAVLQLPAAAAGSLEVFSWWTSGGEAAALQALFDVYNAQYPGVNIINATVAGGGGSAAKAVLQTRLTGGDPPDTWQLHPGAELKRFVDDGYVEPVTQLYREQGWYEVIPRNLIDMMTFNGQVYAVLTGIHRGNVLWYNTKLLQRHGVQPPRTMDDFFAAAQRLKARGVTPLCLGNSERFAISHMFETSIIAAIGPEGYMGLWNGTVSFESPGVRQALRTLARMLDFINPDYSAFGWSAAVERVMAGQCAFNIMGDWAYGDFIAKGQKEGADFGWAAAPGTEGTFVVVADGFPLAKGAPNRANALNWLRSIGSLKAQEAFNPLKGSIPSRIDVDRKKFSAYHNGSMDDFKQNALVPTVTHGSAAPAAFQEALFDALTLFLVDRDADGLARTLARAAREAGFGR